MKLNIFTNCTVSAPETHIIQRTYNSFVETFGEPSSLTVYVDPNPNRRAYLPYMKNLMKLFPQAQFRTTRSLAEGYLFSLKENDDDYMFQLEHDWVFQNIEHTLDRIKQVMRQQGIYHFRFNKHTNEQTDWIRKWQTYIDEEDFFGFKYCETDNLSNNPHIVERQYYLETLAQYIHKKQGSSGIEEFLTKQGFKGHVYGGLGYPPTIVHLDGKNSK